MEFNWLMLGCVYWGLKRQWLTAWLVGLGWDLISGGRLGVNSTLFLFISAGVWLVSRNLRWG